MNIWTYETLKKNRVSACKQKGFLNTLMWISFIKNKTSLLVDILFRHSNCVFWKFCTEDVYLHPLPYNNENTDSRSTSIAQIYFDFF